MFSLRPLFKSLAVLVVLVPSASVVFAQQEKDDEIATALMPSDNNNDSSSLPMTNYNALRKEGQGFYLEEASDLFEKPDSGKTSFVGSNDADTTNYGYVGRAVLYLLGSSKEDAVAQGGQMPSTKKQAVSVSAVLVPTLGIFEGQIHDTRDDTVFRYWDDGSLTLPFLGWEGHDEGDTHPNADTSAFSASGTFTKITTEEAAKYLGMDVADLTPATCSGEYKAAWNATHVPDPIDTSVTDLEETVAQLQADNKELLSRIVAIEGSLPGSGSDSIGDDGEATAVSSSSLFTMAAFEPATMDSVMKSIMTVAVIIGLAAVDFI